MASRTPSAKFFCAGAADSHVGTSCLGDVPPSFNVPSGDVNVLWNDDRVTNKNQMRAALRVAMRMVDSEASLAE